MFKKLLNNSPVLILMNVVFIHQIGWSGILELYLVSMPLAMLVAFGIMRHEEFNKSRIDTDSYPSMRESESSFSKSSRN